VILERPAVKREAPVSNVASAVPVAAEPTSPKTEKKLKLAGEATARPPIDKAKSGGEVNAPLVPVPVASQGTSGISAAKAEIKSEVPAWAPPEAAEPVASEPVAVGALVEYRKPILRPSRSSGLVLFNKVLAGVVLVLLVVVVYSVASIRTDVAAGWKQLEAGVEAPTAMPSAVLAEVLPPVESFIEKVTVRNVFLPKGTVSTAATPAALTGKVADLKLMGVSIDNSASDQSMAIIRNKAESKTYFVDRGQTVGDTGYTLEKVLPDHVVLKMGRQEIILK
jgi:hypothetical protein